MVRITYFTHSTTTDNERGIATGWQPGELSPRGRQQATALAAQLASSLFDAVYSSDQGRAFESAKLFFGERYDVVHDARLRECNYGDFTGRPATEFMSRLVDYIEAPFPGGECYRDVERRVSAFLNDLQRRHEGASIAVVAHQAPQLAFEVLLAGKTWQEAIEQDWRSTGAWQAGWVYET